MTDPTSTSAPASIGDQPVVAARDLSIRYRSHNSRSHYLAVRGVDFDLGHGEILGVIGEAGSGKSSLATAVAGFAGLGHPGAGIPEICGGSLTVYGTGLRHISRRSRDRLLLKVGYLRQDGADRLSPQLTVAENVAEPIFLRDRRFSTREAGEAVATLIDAVHLPLGVLQKLPYELSSGQRQRVALARALILEPTLLVADEPTRGVDATVRDGVLDAILALKLERSFSAIVISSELDALRRIAGRFAVMQHGNIVGIGSIEALVDQPSGDYVAALARAIGRDGSA